MDFLEPGNIVMFSGTRYETVQIESTTWNSDHINITDIGTGRQTCIETSRIESTTLIRKAAP